MRDIVLKVSVPFCVRRCEYCARTVVEGWDAKRMHAYMEAVRREIEANANQFEDCRVVAVRWGGGLATMAHAQDVSDIMKVIRERYRLADDAPVTMRAAIANISGASMPFLKRAGVTRFDFEMMSLFPVGYSLVNKRDTLGDLPVICDHFLHAYACGNLGIVLLYGYSAADPDNFRRSIVEFLRMPASHLTLQRAEGDCAMSDDEARVQLDAVRPLLEEAGFREYLPLRFAKSGSEDRFAVLSAKGAPCLGFGLGATTRIDGVESVNTADLATYCANSSNFAAITAKVRTL